jgi:ribosomal protein L32
MKRRVSLRLLLACSVAASIGSAYAGPEECLTLHDNVAVAGCANKYAPGTSAMAVPTQRTSTWTARQPIEATEKWMLFPVPTPGAHMVAPSREPPEIIKARDRSELIRRAEMGGAAMAGVGMVFGVWRWRVAKVKTCSYCGSRVVPGAAVCKRCFRSL